MKSGVYRNPVLIWIPLAMVVIAAITITQSCKHVVGECKKYAAGETSGSGGRSHSHNPGKNCLGCHYSGGEGDGCFTLGGTVYDSTQSFTITSGTMKLYTGPNGTGDMVLSLGVDGRGNFYTGKNINFIGGLYPAITSNNGYTKYMSTPIKIGACNACHGVTTGKVWSN